MSSIAIKYKYDRFGAGPGILNGNGACSNHHVLPYYMMEYIGLLWVAYCETYPEGSGAYREHLEKLIPAGGVIPQMSAAMRLETNGSTSIYHVTEAAPAFSGFVGLFAWLGDNLFTGPSADYRVSDPSQRCEPERPVSFPKKRWDMLAALWSALAGIQPPRSREEPATQVTVTTKKAKAVLEAAMACLTGKQPHRTLVSDWYAVRREGGQPYTLDVRVLTGENALKERSNSNSYHFCKLDLVGDDVKLDKEQYIRIIEVKQGKAASVLAKREQNAKSETKQAEARGSRTIDVAFHQDCVGGGCACRA